jgi:peptidoglycan hydrolase-like protein with peptidoglycan-binding domain
MKRSFRVATVFTGAAACAAAFGPAAAAAPATPGTTTAAAAAGHVTTPGATADTGCVFQSFGRYDSGYYEECVVDLQVLLNNLWNKHSKGPDQELTADGYFGPKTANDVAHFNHYFSLPGGSVATRYNSTSGGTWEWLCIANYVDGFHGPYFQNADCGALTD